jgi:two-component system sensor histidine kinase CpxA
MAARLDGFRSDSSEISLTTFARQLPHSVRTGDPIAKDGRRTAGLARSQAVLEPVLLGQAVQRAISQQTPGAGNIEVAVPSSLPVLAHEPYLVRVIANLLRNPLRYPGEYAPIHVIADEVDGRAKIIVADCGPGLSADAFDRIFEPFYPPEAARSRETGGAGLGLAIVKTCVEACQGTVSCRNREPAGFEVSVQLPVTTRRSNLYAIRQQLKDT